MPSSSTILKIRARPSNQGGREGLEFPPAPPVQTTSRGLLPPSNLNQHITSKRRKLKNIQHRQLSSFNLIREILQISSTPCRPTKIRHPSLPKLSINKCRISHDPRPTSSLTRITLQEGRGENKIRTKPPPGVNQRIFQNPGPPPLSVVCVACVVCV